MNTNAKDIRIFFGGEVRKTSEDNKLSYMLQKAKYLEIPFQIEEDETKEKAIAYHPYVIKIFEDTKKTFENNPNFPSHYECSFSLASIGKIDGLLVDTSLIFRRFFHGEQKITPSFNARMVVDCSKIVVNNYVEGYGEDGEDGEGEQKNVYCEFLQKTGHSGGVSTHTEKFTIEFVNACLNEIKDLTSSLKFDKLTSQFGKSDFKLESSFFGEEYCAGVECCVCMEKTFSRTFCEHALCCVCWSSLKKKSCPLCRKGIFLQYDSNEEEPEDNDEYNDEDN